MYQRFGQQIKHLLQGNNINHNSFLFFRENRSKNWGKWCYW